MHQENMTKCPENIHPRPHKDKRKEACPDTKPSEPDRQQARYTLTIHGYNTSTHQQDLLARNSPRDQPGWGVG